MGIYLKEKKKNSFHILKLNTLLLLFLCTALKEKKKQIKNLKKKNK